MSAVTITGLDARQQTQISQTDNVATLKKGLSAIDTHGNVYEVPNYTIKDILDSIPKKCYERSAIKSLLYVARDIALYALSIYLANTYIPLVGSPVVRAALWTTHAIASSLFGTGLWVMAHECGHRAFSDYETLDHFVGWVLHLYWLVPFFSWKFTHGKHHKATGNLKRDMVFVPPTKEEFIEQNLATKLAEIGEETPVMSLVYLLRQQFGGWIAYLLTNVTGQQYKGWDNKWAVNHFNPNAPIFDKKDYYYVLLSDLGMITQLTVLYFWYQRFGGWSVFINWFLPYIGVNHWLVFITYLQHTGPEMPHYDADQWNFARGAACTIDRSFPFVGPYLFHDIIETHVLHHYVSRIPFYNAREGTEAIKKVMGKQYLYLDENMWVSLWKATRMCQFVDGDNGVRMYRNVNHLGVAPIDVDGKKLE